MSMGTQTQAGREFWHGVLMTGGFTSIPRWSDSPGTVINEHEAPISAGLEAGLRRLAVDLAVSPSAVLLAAHAKVLSALSGEQEVTTGYVPAQGYPPMKCPLRTRAASWRQLITDAHEIQSQLLAHKNFPIDDFCRELGLTEPMFETVIDPSGAGGELDDATVLWLKMVSRADRFRLRLRYRTDVIDAGAAARIVGYHLTALSMMAVDPDAEHGRQSLLSEQELEFQLEGLRGPSRSLPDARFHELFEQRVRAHPDAVAGVQGDRRWTYRELNARANRLGRTLLDTGLPREGVVAVVTERNLDWMAAVIAVFKAGGVYLPIEPHFPADRIATTLTRAECRLVLTEDGSRSNLDQALKSLSGIQILPVGVTLDDDRADGNRTDDDSADHDLGVVVTADQLAYIYFTSGSTGEPKGAMCEHAGMLNHLYAKLDDLEIAQGSVVAQTAPQCFDISLWQLVAGLLVGARTLLIEQQLILDVERFVDTVADGRVAVMQLVPSYLEAVVTLLEQRPRKLPDLQYVSVTGEALKRELTERWFAVAPGIKLVNAYGLTETSDDTNHEVMDRASDGERVPLGRAVNNVRIYVVDEHMVPVPLGAPGAIVFSGICVGRGYINDPDRTRQAFMSDPYHPGDRLYQAGDYGRWLPDGKLEFLGRRDSQVKIRGFRIEIGEIDNALLRVPNIRDAAVVVAERADHSKQLVAFYSGSRPLDTELLRDLLATSLPEYMVPSAFHWRDRLPLTANSKIDRRALTALAGTLDVAAENSDDPTTPTERRLAAAWAKVLGTRHDQIGRQDHFFFDCGGSSLSAVKLAITLERVVSLTDVTRYPVLAELAALIDGRQAAPRNAPAAVGA
jgi:amino acid adenylation domain-containing protein